MPFRDKRQVRRGFRKRQEFSEPSDGFNVRIEDRQEKFTFDPVTSPRNVRSNGSASYLPFYEETPASKAKGSCTRSHWDVLAAQIVR